MIVIIYFSESFILKTSSGSATNYVLNHLAIIIIVIIVIIIENIS